MKKFLAVYIGTATAQEKSEWVRTTDPAERQKLERRGMEAWETWMKDNQAQVVEQGAPLGKTKRVGPQGITDITNTMVGYVVIQAESHQAAARLFENHPHFTIFPGDSVEIMECLPLPAR